MCSSDMSRTIEVNGKVISGMGIVSQNQGSSGGRRA